jgi:hypothetical protein
MVSAAMACLPAAVSMLLLEALFMQISGVSLALTYPAGFVYSEFSCVWASATSFPLSKLTGKGDTAPAFSGLRVYLQFMWEVGLPPSPVQFSSHCHFYKLSCSWLLGGAAVPASHHVCLQFMWEVCLPPLLWSFPPSATLTSFPASGCWMHAPAPARASLACPACLFTVPGRIPFPQSSALSEPHPLSRMSLLFLLLITQFLFFPRVEVCLSRGYAALARVVCGSTVVPRSSPCPRVPKPSGRRRLVAWGPSLFLYLTWSGDSLYWVEV